MSASIVATSPVSLSLTAQARACALALQGDGFVWDQLMSHALNGTESLKGFVTAVAQALAEMNGIPGTSLASLKRAKVKGASTLEVYSGQLTRLATDGCLEHPGKGRPLSRGEAGKFLKAATAAGLKTMAERRAAFLAWAAGDGLPEALPTGEGEGEGQSEGEGQGEGSTDVLAGITPAMALACLSVALAAGDKEAMAGLEALANRFLSTEVIETVTRVVTD